jgi:hypothetical protein
MGMPDEEEDFRPRLLGSGRATGWRRPFVYGAILFFALPPFAWLIRLIVRAI